MKNNRWGGKPIEVPKKAHTEEVKKPLVDMTRLLVTGSNQGLTGSNRGLTGGNQESIKELKELKEPERVYLGGNLEEPRKVTSREAQPSTAPADPNQEILNQRHEAGIFRGFGNNTPNPRPPVDHALHRLTEEQELEIAMRELRGDFVGIGSEDRAPKTGDRYPAGIGSEISNLPRDLQHLQQRFLEEVRFFAIHEQRFKNEANIFSDSQGALFNKSREKFAASFLFAYDAYQDLNMGVYHTHRQDARYHLYHFENVMKVFRDYIKKHPEPPTPYGEPGPSNG